MEERIGECDGIGIASVPAPTSQSRGRPKFYICKEQIEHLLKLNFTGPKIAGLLDVSLRTLRRRMNEYQLSVSQLYSDISDTELLRRVKDIQNSFPN